MSKIKNIDSLINYLNEDHNIKTNKLNDKKSLMNIGYYHGYKGYRFIKNPNNKINYSNFSQILSVNKFDMKLKALFYPNIMFIETALKNHVLEILLNETQTDCFNEIYELALLDYKSYPLNSKDYKLSMKKRLNLRNQIYSVITRDYNGNKPVVQHFYHNDRAVPIWAIFEIITLGEFGNFVTCLNQSIKKQVSKSLNLNQSCDESGNLTEKIIYLLKDLRNSIAHNNVIFDTRFRTNNVSKSLIKCLELDTNIKNITFNTLVDYLILIVYMLKNLYIEKNELSELITSFQYSLDSFREEIEISTYTKIFYTYTKNKLNLLKEFVSKEKPCI